MACVLNNDLCGSGILPTFGGRNPPSASDTSLNEQQRWQPISDASRQLNCIFPGVFSQLTGDFICTPGSSYVRRSCHHNIVSNFKQRAYTHDPDIPGQCFTSILTKSQIVSSKHQGTYGRSTFINAHSRKCEDLTPVRLGTPGLARDRDWLAAGHCPLRSNRSNGLNRGFSSHDHSVWHVQLVRMYLPSSTVAQESVAFVLQILQG